MSATLIEIFRLGKHTAMAGEEIEFTASDVEAIAEAYDPALHEAPIVVGHPAHDLPAYGWVKGLAFMDGHLVAELDQVDPQFRKIVRDGRYKKLSASFYKPDSPANPTPGTWYLRHVGFLGAQAPAIKGLRPVAFAADDDAVEFAAPSEMEMIRAGRDRRSLGRAKHIGREAVDWQERQAELGIVVTTAAAVRHVKARIDATAFGERLPAGADAAQELARRAREHQARLAGLGVSIGAGDAVRQVLAGIRGA